jgi:hypothetical protein
MSYFGDQSKSELAYMTASPYGDIFDVLQQPVASSDVLSLYRVLWLAGDVVLPPSAVVMLLEYCDGGGVVVVQSDQLLQTGEAVATLTGENRMWFVYLFFVDLSVCWFVCWFGWLVCLLKAIS